MEKTIVAIPSQLPGGLDAGIDSHFGHCGIYTIVTIENNAVSETHTLPTIPHQQGGCMAPVQYLADHKVQALISGGMGMRPLMGFQQVGVSVFHGIGFSTVKEAVEAFIAGKLQPFSMEHTCGGGAR